MSGFSPDWLALREVADLRARNAVLQDAMVEHFAATSTMRITDLGCGTGSNLRALALRLAPVQHWRLVDHDATLLEAAARLLAAWADKAEPTGGARLRLRHAGRIIDVDFVQADLVTEIEAILAQPADLVTAAAFFDLVSSDWIERFVASSVGRRLPLFTVLTYDGRETWLPAHALDASMLASFHAHQARDKGFGPAAGPFAAPALAAAYRAHGWNVMTADSRWMLEETDFQLMAALADGAAAAISETGLLPPAAIDQWRRARRTAAQCEIGHLDLFARPPAVT